MRTFLTALAFLVILIAVIPAVKRSLYPRRKDTAMDLTDHIPKNDEAS